MRASCPLAVLTSGLPLASESIARLDKQSVVFGMPQATRKLAAAEGFHGTSGSQPERKEAP